jgi:uncharacterized protein (TIGR02145 family)
MRKMLAVLLTALICFGCQKENDNNSNTNPSSAHSCGSGNVHNPSKAYGSLKDIDGNTYKTIQIGNQEWMAENLKTTKYSNGVSIPNITDDNEWRNSKTGAYCSYKNDMSNDCPYGKLYNWYAVVDTNKLCPTGWHVPADEEWKTLIVSLDSTADFSNGDFKNTAGGQMKTAGTGYWLNSNKDGTNSSGFSGLPGGGRYDAFEDGPFSYKGRFGYWWSSTSTGVTSARYYYLYYGGGILDGLKFAQENGISVRCVRD